MNTNDDSDSAASGMYDEDNDNVPDYEMIQQLYKNKKYINGQEDRRVPRVKKLEEGHKAPPKLINKDKVKDKLSHGIKGICENVNRKKKIKKSLEEDLSVPIDNFVNVDQKRKKLLDTEINDMCLVWETINQNADEGQDLIKDTPAESSDDGEAAATQNEEGEDMIIMLCSNANEYMVF